MTLSQAWQAFKDSVYAMWIYHEPEPFSYIRDVDELTDATEIELTNVKSMNNQPIAIVPTTNVEGNITSCKIETAKVSIDRESPMSFVQHTTYQSYDVCTKEVIDSYVMPEVTGFAFFISSLGAILLFMVISFAISAKDYDPTNPFSY